MSSTLLIGYDVERIPGRVPGEKWVGRKVPEDSTRKFLRQIIQVHKDTQTPATIFMVGCNIETHIPELEACLASGLFEIAQHTQEHFALKTFAEEGGSYIYHRGLDFDKIEEQLARPVELLKKYLGVECKGLTAPYTYYRGFSDRPDILEIVARHGMVYTRSYGRNANDYFPTSWDVQPFWYSRQGFDDILETPVQGFIDAQWRHDNGWDKQQEYFDYLKGQAEMIKDKNLCWGHIQHDWTSLLCDEDLSWTRRFIELAAKNFEMKTYYDYYQDMIKKKTAQQK